MTKKVENPTGIHPRGAMILVKMEVEKELKGLSIALPDEFLDKSQMSGREATVVEVSPQGYKAWFDGERWCEPGDKVLVRQFSGTNSMVGGEIYRLIEDKDVMAVLDDVYFEIKEKAEKQ